MPNSYIFQNLAEIAKIQGFEQTRENGPIPKISKMLQKDSSISWITKPQ